MSVCACVYDWLFRWLRSASVYDTETHQYLGAANSSFLAQLTLDGNDGTYLSGNGASTRGDETLSSAAVHAL